MAVSVFDFSSIGEGSSELFFVKLALFFISFILIFVTLRKFFDKKDVIVVTMISVAMSIMIVYFAPIEVVLDYFLTSYGLFGILTISFLPFFLLFFFLESFDFALMRKVGFAFVGILYFIIGYCQEGIFSIGTSWDFDIAWIYYGMGLVSFLVLIFEKWVRRKMLR
jgi:hypothetical protein